MQITATTNAPPTDAPDIIATNFVDCVDVVAPGTTKQVHNLVPPRIEQGIFYNENSQICTVKCNLPIETLFT